ncbi:MAG: hypothetical protein AAGC88_03005, partial [Bacteroidota bacterium]
SATSPTANGSPKVSEGLKVIGAQKSNRKKQTPSLTNIIVPSAEETGPTDNESTEKPEEEKKNQPLEIESVQSAWNSFRDEHMNKDDAKKVHQIFLNNAIELVNETDVIVEIKNDVENKVLADIETELIQFLRQSLNNDFIKIITKLLESDTSKKPYTGKEKFDHMLSQNENLKLLTEKLGLDYDS